MSLDLDERQRAMLEEMQIRVWWPLPERAEAALPASAKAVVQAAPRAVPQRPPGPAAVATQAPPPTALSSAGPADGLDWPALAAAVAGCTACGLCEGRKAAVFMPEAVPRQVDWLVVGEPPDADEERAGQPFVGEAGQLLDNMLRAVQVHRGGVGATGARLTTVVKCRPAAVRNPQADEVATCARYLRREIALAQPKVILALGRFAVASLLGASYPELAGLPLGKLRGQVFRFEGIPVVVTTHPTRLLRAQHDKAGVWADLCLALSLARPQA